MRLTSGELGARMDAMGMGAGDSVAVLRAEAAAGRGVKPYNFVGDEVADDITVVDQDAFEKVVQRVSKVTDTDREGVRKFDERCRDLEGGDDQGHSGSVPRKAAHQGGTYM